LWIREGRTRGIEVDGRGCRLTSHGKHHVSCECGRIGIANSDERAARTAMNPIAEPFHATSHHQRDPERIAKLSRINRYHVQTFAHFLERLRSTSDGDGSLLDHSTILYGGGLSDGDKHNHVNLPIAILGGGAGRLKGGRPVRLPMDTPLANVHLTLLDHMDIHLDRFGDSTGRIDQLAGA
jgi:hypothetical protein